MRGWRDKYLRYLRSLADVDATSLRALLIFRKAHGYGIHRVVATCPKKWERRVSTLNYSVAIMYLNTLLGLSCLG